MQVRAGKGLCYNFEIVDEHGNRLVGWEELDTESLCEGADWIIMDIEERDYIHRGRTPEEAFLSRYLEALEGARELYEQVRRNCEEKLSRLREECERGVAPRRVYEAELRSCQSELREWEEDIKFLEDMVEGLRSGRYRVRVFREEGG